MFSYGRKRKHSAKGSWKGRKRSRLPTYRRDPYGYGPVGGSVAGRRQGTTHAIVRQPAYLPDRLFTRWRTPINGVFSTGAAGAFVGKYLRVSACTSAAGGTVATIAPAGVTQLLGATACYKSYIVHAFRVEIVISNVTVGAAGTTYNLAFGAAPQAAVSAAPGSITALQQMPRSWVTMQNPYQQPMRYSRFWRIGEIYGQTPQSVAIADSFSALYNAVPASEVLFHIGYEDQAGATALTFNLQIVLTQYVELFGRNPPT